MTEQDRQEVLDLIREVLTENGASVDDVPEVENPHQSATMMPCVEYDSLGNAQRYVRVKISTIARIAAEQSDADFESLETAIEEEHNSRISTSFASVSYDRQNKIIRFFNAVNQVVGEINATDFVKDGMVNSVTVTNQYIVITFNTDAGKEAIRIPLADIFNPSNYYDKDDVDDKLEGKLDDITEQEFNSIFND